MNNIDRIQEYIQDAVISPLERLMKMHSGTDPIVHSTIEVAFHMRLV